MPAIYFQLGLVQPFADMSAEQMPGQEGVTLVKGDGKLVGLRLSEPQMVMRLPEIIAQLDLDADRVWNKLRADDDVMLGRRAAVWGGGGP
jgi:hypothetical protein